MRLPATLLQSLLLLFVFVVAQASTSSAQTLYVDPQFGFTLTPGVVFAQKDIGNPAGTVDLRLQLYEPSGAGVPSSRPVLVGIHGGGFTTGSRTNTRITDVCEAMAQRGYTCVSIDYRLEGANPVVGSSFQALDTLFGNIDPGFSPCVAAATEDAVAAIQWLLDNHVTLDISPTRMAVFGYSAGGMVTEVVGYMTDEGSFPRPVAPLATFLMSGAFDTGSPIVSSNDPAILMSHGDIDSILPVWGAIEIDDQASIAGIPHELDVLVGEDHQSIDIFVDEVAPGETVFDRSVAFMYQHVALAPEEAPAPGAVPALTPIALYGLVGGLAILGATRSRSSMAGR